MVLNNYEWYYKYHSGIIETGKCTIEYFSDIDWYSYDEWYFQIPFGYLPVSLRPACVPLRTSVVFNGIQW